MFDVVAWCTAAKKKENVVTHSATVLVSGQCHFSNCSVRYNVFAAASKRRATRDQRF